MSVSGRGAPSALVLWPCRRQPRGYVLAGGVDDRVRAGGQRGAQAGGDDIGHGHLPHPAELQPDHRPEPDGPSAENHNLVRGPGLGAVHAVPGDRHRLVERSDLEGQVIREDRHALARDGVLDEQVLAHAAQRAAAAGCPTARPAG